MRPIPDAVAGALYAAGLLAVAGALAWATGRALVFPSLGPSAYLLAAGSDRPSARALLGGHAVGIFAGLLAYHGLADGAAITGALAAGGSAGARLAASAVASVGLTTLGMALTDTRHAPACATTLIVSLGLLPSPADAAVIAVGVFALWLASRATALASRAGLTVAAVGRVDR
ncbi:HPP family protein [Halobaculum gomorrense]|uniref:HPP family protein n=1 Tax=Halobaculum gomorrense TaxID=43928 RepID=A0A1M5K4G1_9EURY|nr:HPP family protein [Halobaculum gomorrense]SHG47712.1 HPP family protein [Halobaculum gomorrense]